MGDWPGFHSRYHNPIEDAYFQKFKQVPSHHSYHPSRIPNVTCHGILRYTNPNFLEDMDQLLLKHSLWNRYFLFLKFRYILNRLRHDGTISGTFTRVIQVGSIIRLPEDVPDDCCVRQKLKRPRI
ncbi:hypothetical protein PHYBLDRAFT_168141 [Phycomyces blakesleeanus NRRL 1555(-)]|uniref:Uncharacterized protein n=1 Tax=Phycomyces blakesleeanus (strain ATCC 8743b / DSM 1359 / FGSC 10004 / NBRC 33097 / NRRL 1555) TaxID=763407 RepID=A0A162XBF6_PHYB8|nr:hypothetical protein PHYBLDRAFT_168141 [Phycomyces blakesleeanus NRRL 1555(-)]OAD73705.1 hypothetical protein PHYBLDRAFT_168141 [Phycomyces blakesleeanus NRRL 1555(-)]|eukprot:XP_018291745.1 hypothetical protein PHYBLDRAFT_168141 [Phycomyces blakesleeanus NRRL 1555(-)]